MLSTPQEIRRQSGHVSSAAEDIRREQSKNDSSTSQSSSWWKGGAGDAYRSEYEEITRDVTRLLGHMRELQNQLQTLAGAVQRADDERRAKAEEEARRALAAAAARKK